VQLLLRPKFRLGCHAKFLVEICPFIVVYILDRLHLLPEFLFSVLLKVSDLGCSSYWNLKDKIGNYLGSINNFGHFSNC